MVEIASGTLEQDQLDPNDVFIVDLEKEIFVWVGDSKFNIGLPWLPR